MGGGCCTKILLHVQFWVSYWYTVNDVFLSINLFPTIYSLWSNMYYSHLHENMLLTSYFIVILFWQTILFTVRSAVDWDFSINLFFNKWLACTNLLCLLYILVWSSSPLHYSKSKTIYVLSDHIIIVLPYTFSFETWIRKQISSNTQLNWGQFVNAVN